MRAFCRSVEMSQSTPNPEGDVDVLRTICRQIFKILERTHRTKAAVHAHQHVHRFVADQRQRERDDLGTHGQGRPRQAVGDRQHPAARLPRTRWREPRTVGVRVADEVGVPTTARLLRQGGLCLGRHPSSEVIRGRVAVQVREGRTVVTCVRR